MFVRVRGKTPGDPRHEFDVPVQAVERHPERYEVIDKEPVAKQRPASLVSGVVPTKKSAPADQRSAKPAKKQAPSPGETSTAPVGANS